MKEPDRKRHTSVTGGNTEQAELHTFRAVIGLIGINPFVRVPPLILEAVFRQAGKDKGPLPVKGYLNGKAYKQTLVRFRGDWRLYINTEMLPQSPKRVGERVEISLVYDPEDRKLAADPALKKALSDHPQAEQVFRQLTVSRQQEIIRYISYLKTEESRKKNIQKAIDFLCGRGRFAGRDKP
jgi:hypothetical protein